MKPRHIAYIIWSTIALLGVVCWLVPKEGWTLGVYTLRFPTLSQALELEITAAPDTSFLAETLLSFDTSFTSSPDISTASSPDTVSVSKLSLISEANYQPHTQSLSAFYHALDSVAYKPVRVVHYGDSQIEEDRITNVLRERWQKQYGGGGVGLIPLHQTIPTRSIRQRIAIDGEIQSIQKGPKRYIVYGPKSMRLADSDEYGVMGQVALMDSTIVSGSEDIVLNIEPFDSKRKPHHYFNRVRVLTDSVRVNDLEIGITDFELPDSTIACNIHLQGRGKVYGVSLEADKGIIVDNIPMRGCSGNIFTRIDSAQLASFYRETNTRLIIMQFGGNMIPQTENQSTITGYVRHTLRQQIRYIRTCAPQASILFIGPSDMSTRIDGQMVTYPLVPYMDQQLKKMTQEEHIAYWSMYDAMGGYNSMVAWYESGLAGSDYVHFTRAGANKIGKMLYNWIEENKVNPEK